ncbi:MAG TPA: sigma-70 family RNA polymerase sigma factor, partial [Phycisphaerales bacterium]|nr:sigma-70 family RNA polymerase sigma factor [Phycisphaerales bacterium]
TCMVNRVRDRFRRKHPHLVDIDETDPPGSPMDGPEHSAMADEETKRLTQAMATLPDEQRETIVLHLSAGLTFREIAEMQDISMSTVQGRYRYGLDKLRKALTGEQEP